MEANPRGGRRRIVPVIVAHNELWVVVDKPARFLVGVGSDRDEGTLDHADVFEKAGIAIDDLHSVHRIDPDASGLVIYARGRGAEAKLRAARAEAPWTTGYHCLVSGYYEDAGPLDIGVSYVKRTGRLESSEQTSASTHTDVQIVQRVAGHTWIECTTQEARADVMRAQLASAGYPLSIDPQYGNDSAIFLSRFKPDYRPSKRRPERPLIDRLTLHGSSILIPASAEIGGVAAGFSAEIPRELRATVKQLGRLAER